MMDIQSKRMRQRSIENLRWRPVKVHPTNHMSPCIAPIQFVGVEIDGKSIGEFKIGCLEAGPVWTVREGAFNSGVIVFPVSPKQQPDKKAEELRLNDNERAVKHLLKEWQCICPQTFISLLRVIFLRASVRNSKVSIIVDCLQGESWLNVCVITSESFTRFTVVVNGLVKNTHLTPSWDEQ